MPIRVLAKQDLRDTARHVRHDAYETFRLLLASDGLGVSVTDIVLRPDIEATYGYDNHLEIAYCIEGKAVLTDLSADRSEAILPGTMWIAEKGDRFLFRASEPTRLICVFIPPFVGHETGFAGDQ